MSSRNATCAIVGAELGLGQFLIVDASGAPDADHTSLQKAIEAAADGSEILVRDGMYTPVEIVAKSLRIVADESRLSFLSSLTVRDLAAGQAVTVRGLRFHPGPEVLDTAIAVRDCAGSVWLEELEVTDEVASLSPTTSLEVSSSLVEVEDSASVVLSRCLLAGVAPVDDD